ncbi:MAG: pilus assembly protein PilM [Candidatus Omnitrophica bacterium]|nr:pilus assembly protein PilM [Candidatus Omnitrophota bacterium]MBU1870245.1 pilus assembly protein PilM [Candidatus Omnitrophota bacterium]
MMNLNMLMKKRLNYVFVCQFSEGALKIVKIAPSKIKTAKVIDFSFDKLSAQPEDKAVFQSLKKLGYDGQPIIVCLPRQYATLRFIKIPSQSNEEIDRIAKLQSSHYLPYAVSELITGFQVFSTDKSGYSDVNLVIVQKEIIDKTVDSFKGLKQKSLKIILSSYGIAGVFSYFNPQEKKTVLISDIDSQQAELAILSEGKLVFSRSFRLTTNAPGAEKIILEEIVKTRDAYYKEISKTPLEKIVLLKSKSLPAALQEALKSSLNLPVEILNYSEKAFVDAKLVERFSNEQGSFSGLIGLGIQEFPDTLSLLPDNLKETLKLATRRKELVRLGLFILGTIAVLFLVAIKNLDNKSLYLKKIKAELAKIEKQARPLEETEKRALFMKNTLQKKGSAIEIIHEISKALPSQISLINLVYEEPGNTTIRGQAQDLTFVFNFVSQLEKAKVFNGYDIKVRYASKKKTTGGEIVEFEITCTKK